MDTPFIAAPQLTPEFVSEALHLNIAVLPLSDVPFTSVTTDSRKVTPGCLFVALQGDHFDGNTFLDAAIAQGARGLLFKKGTAISSYSKDICLFPMEDPLAGYRRLGGAWRREFSIPVIAVAGSAGKTTTKELLAAILQGKWPHVLKTQGSQNGFVGIPMTLLGLKPEHSAAIIEVGIDDVGAMQQHMNLVSANTAVLTAIGPEHLEHLIDIPTVAHEEGIALSTVAKAGGTVVINQDDPWIRPHTATLREGRKIIFSLNEQALPGESIHGRLSADGSTLTFHGMGLAETSIPLPLPGKHNASNLLAAITIAAGLGLTSQEIQKGLLGFKGAEGRSEIRTLPQDLTVICDYYNAQPASMNAGLELLHQISRKNPHPQPRWACLADMLEMGPEEEQIHRDLAQKILDLNIENVLLYGPRMLALCEELSARGFQGFLSHFSTHAELAASLIEKVKPQATLLIKGSRGMKMEEVWKILESNPHP